MCVGHHFWIVLDIDDLRMVTHVFVHWNLLGATGVADAGPDDARQRPEEGVPRPEAAHAEGGTLATLDLLQLAWHPAERANIVTFEDTRT